MAKKRWGDFKGPPTPALFKCNLLLGHEPLAACQSWKAEITTAKLEIVFTGDQSEIKIKLINISIFIKQIK